MVEAETRKRLILNTCVLVFLVWYSLFNFRLVTSTLLTLPFIAFAFLDKSTVLFRLLMDKCPPVRRWFWKRWYDFCGRAAQTSQIHFLNYGYDSPVYANFPLDGSQEPNRYSIQLYHFTATSSGQSLQNCDILDVGCGRGGGTSFLSNYLKPKSITGLDFSQENIDKAREAFRTNSRLRFESGDAENMVNFQDESFDVVVNVESSHCYGNFPKFLSEVRRVLRPGGYFLFVDLRGEDKMAGFLDALQKSRLELVKTTDITENVLRALELESPRKENFVETAIPRYVRFIVREFMAVKGSNIYNAFSKRTLQYHHVILRKEGRSAAVASAGSSSSPVSSRSPPSPTAATAATEPVSGSAGTFVAPPVSDTNPADE